MSVCIYNRPSVCLGIDNDFFWDMCGIENLDRWSSSRSIFWFLARLHHWGGIFPVGSLAIHVYNLILLGEMIFFLFSTDTIRLGAIGQTIYNVVQI